MKNWKEQYPYLKEWANGKKWGTPHVTNHPICALREVRATFTGAQFLQRLHNWEKGYSSSYTGENYKWPPLTTVEEIMDLDLRMLCSAVSDGFTIILYTNDREDERWLQRLRDLPFARVTMEVPSKMEKYNVQQWLLDPRLA
jgi:hypothetical protein